LRGAPATKQSIAFQRCHFPSWPGFVPAIHVFRRG
jgi:hypothetical protein